MLLSANTWQRDQNQEVGALNPFRSNSHRRSSSGQKPTTTGTTSGPSSTRRGSLCTRFACVCACFEQNIHAPGYLFRAYKIPHVWVCVCVCALGIAPTAQQQKTVSSALALPRACNLFRPGEEPTKKKNAIVRARVALGEMKCQTGKLVRALSVWRTIAVLFAAALGGYVIHAGARWQTLARHFMCATPPPLPFPPPKKGFCECHAKPLRFDCKCRRTGL